jgi:hypothetical protein
MFLTSQTHSRLALSILRKDLMVAQKLLIRLRLHVLRLDMGCENIGMHIIRCLSISFYLSNLTELLRLFSRARRRCLIEGATTLHLGGGYADIALGHIPILLDLQRLLGLVLYKFTELVIIVGHRADLDAWTILVVGGLRRLIGLLLHI